jgi:hypothetical protein
MTLPNERINAFKNVRRFLRSLLVPSETPKVPLEIRRRARQVLKHFPSDFDMSQLSEQNGYKKVFGEKWPTGDDD